MSEGAVVPTAKKRLAALDQFRGYTMAGMFLVNFIGGYAAVHPIFGHHRTYCSYADTIMPAFFFAVGFSFRLSYLRREREVGAKGARRHAVWRNLKLLLIGFIFYNMENFIQIPDRMSHNFVLPFVVNFILCDTFEALVSIAVTCLWILPVIGRGPGARWGYLVFTCVLHILNLHFFYYRFAHDYVIDGGPLGFAGWAVPTLLGTLVCDAVRENSAPMAQWKRLWPWAVGFMVGGYALACLNLWGAPGTGIGRFLVEPPFVPPTRPVDMWTMDQQIAGPSYMVFSAGLCVSVYLLFVLISDVWGVQVGVFRTLGKNPLFGYLYHSVVGAVVGGYMLKGDSSIWAVMGVFGVYFFIVWATLRVMEWRNWIWKL